MGTLTSRTKSRLQNKTTNASSSKRDIRSLKGIVRSRLKTRAVSVKEMNEAIAQGFSR